MSKVEQSVIDAAVITIVALHRMNNPPAHLARQVVPAAFGDYLSPRQTIEMSVAIGRKLHEEVGGHTDCNCEARNLFLLDVLDFLEKQQLKDEIIMEQIADITGDYTKFCDTYGKPPVITYVRNEFTLATSVSGIYFMNPSVVH